MEESIGASVAIITNAVSNDVAMQKPAGNEPAGENTDSNGLVPFIQLLNQQITLLNPVPQVAPLNPGFEQAVRLSNELTCKNPPQKNINAGDFKFIKDETTDLLLKQNSMQAMVRELSEIKGVLPELEAIGESTLSKNGDSKSIADILTDQLTKANNFKPAENETLIDNPAKVHANVADKSGLANMTALRASTANMAENFKNALKENHISGDKNSQDISTNSVAAVNSGMAKVSSPADIPVTQMINRIAGEIKEKMSTDGGRIKITLNPPSLGTLEMDVAVRNNKVEVIIVADNKDVQQTLNTHIDRLKGSLLNQGLTVDRCDVLMQNNRDGYQQNLSQQAFYRDGSAQSKNTSKEKYNEELKPATSVAPQIINHQLRHSDNISIFV